MGEIKEKLGVNQGGGPIVIDPHYSLRFAYSLILFCNPQIKPSGGFAFVPEHAQSSENFQSSNTHMRSQSAMK